MLAVVGNDGSRDGVLPGYRTPIRQERFDRFRSSHQLATAFDKSRKTLPFSITAGDNGAAFGSSVSVSGNAAMASSRSPKGGGVVPPARCRL
jgi:hypothetical protein